MLRNLPEAREGGQARDLGSRMATRRGGKTCQTPEMLQVLPGLAGESVLEKTAPPKNPGFLGN